MLVVDRDWFSHAMLADQIANLFDVRITLVTRHVNADHCNPWSFFSSRHCAMRGRLSLQMPQLADQKCTSVGRPSAFASAAAWVPPNHSVAPSSRGICVPIFIAIVLHLLKIRVL